MDNPLWRSPFVATVPVGETYVVYNTLAPELVRLDGNSLRLLNLFKSSTDPAGLIQAKPGLRASLDLLSRHRLLIPRDLNEQAALAQRLGPSGGLPLPEKASIEMGGAADGESLGAILAALGPLIQASTQPFSLTFSNVNAPAHWRQLIRFLEDAAENFAEFDWLQLFVETEKPAEAASAAKALRGYNLGWRLMASAPVDDALTAALTALRESGHPVLLDWRVDRLPIDLTDLAQIPAAAVYLRLPDALYAQHSAEEVWQALEQARRTLREAGRVPYGYWDRPIFSYRLKRRPEAAFAPVHFHLDGVGSRQGNGQSVESLDPVALAEACRAWKNDLFPARCSGCLVQGLCLGGIPANEAQPVKCQVAGRFWIQYLTRLFSAASPESPAPTGDMALDG